MIQPFLANGMPTGWDSAAYLAWTNSLKTGGLSYVQSPAFIQYTGMNVIPGLLLLSTVSLTQSALLGYVIFQLLILALFFISTLVLSFRLRGSVTYAMLSFFILTTSFAFLRSTIDLYASLLCVALLQFALVALLELRSDPGFFPSLTLAFDTSLMLITDVEIGAFGVMVLILTAISLTSFKGVPLRKTIRLLSPILIGTLTSVFLWLPFAATYIPISTVNVGSGGIADWHTIIDELGGPLLSPICAIGIGIILYGWKRGSENVSSSAMASWFATFSIFFVVAALLRPGLLYRVALLLPLYFFVPEAMRGLYDAYARTKMLAGHWRTLTLVAIVVVSAVISASSVSTFASQTTSDKTSPFLSRQNYQVLTNLTNVLHSSHYSPSATVFLVYPQQRLRQPQDVSAWTNFYDNWIFATVGPHLTYYGTMENLTANVPIDYVSSDERATYSFYHSSFERERTTSSVNVMIVSFMYAGNPLILDNLSIPVNGVYSQSVNLRDPLPNGWVPSYYAIDEHGGYFTSHNWSLFGNVLESYSSTPVVAGKNFNVTFALFVTTDANYSLNVRMMDYDPSNSPITASVDNRSLFAFNYYGSREPRIFSGDVGFLSRGYHTIILGTLPDMPHNLDLDGIMLSPSRILLSSAAEIIPPDWQVVDGIGNVIANLPNEHLTTVSGTPNSSSGVLGARSLFDQPLNFTGSRFIVFKVNSSTSDSIILWVTDSNGNLIRYDTANFSPGKMILVVFPLTTNYYSFVSAVPPNFSSIISVELGISGPQQAQLSFQFSQVVLSLQPLPWDLVS